MTILDPSHPSCSWRPPCQRKQAVTHPNPCTQASTTLGGKDEGVQHPGTEARLRSRDRRTPGPSHAPAEKKGVLFGIRLSQTPPLSPLATRARAIPFPQKLKGELVANSVEAIHPLLGPLRKAKPLQVLPNVRHSRVWGGEVSERKTSSF